MAVSRGAAVAGDWQCDGSGSAGIEGGEASGFREARLQLVSPVEDNGGTSLSKPWPETVLTHRG